MWICCEIMQMLQLLPRLPFRGLERLLNFIGIYNPLICCCTGHPDTQGDPRRNQGFNLDLRCFICPHDALLAGSPWWNAAVCGALTGSISSRPPHFMLICVKSREIAAKTISNRRIHLLVSSLDGAVSLIEVDDISEFVTCWGRKRREKNGWGGEDGSSFSHLSRPTFHTILKPEILESEESIFPAVLKLIRALRSASSGLLTTWFELIFSPSRRYDNMNHVWCSCQQLHLLLLLHSPLLKPDCWIFPRGAWWERTSRESGCSLVNARPPGLCRVCSVPRLELKVLSKSSDVGERQMSLKSFIQVL